MCANMAVIRHPPSCTCPMRPSLPDLSTQKPSTPANQLPISEYRPPPPLILPENPVDVRQHQFAPTRKNYSRRNAWGNLSYADLITKAIQSAPDRRLTLSQIYEWMVRNIPYFKDKGNSNSSSGWKNSIRHTLTLHGRFERIQNEGSGRSSWWVVNPNAPRNGKSMRRRSGLSKHASTRPPGKQGEMGKAETGLELIKK